MLDPNLQKRPDRRLGVLFWAIFILGLLLQFAGPQLLIEGNRFVMPQKMVEKTKIIDPAALVARFRRTRVLSAILTLGGAVGLAFCYRQALFKQRRR